MSFIVAIDGPAGTGKGTITKLIAEKLGFTNIDTGATYRCIALAMLREKVSLTEEEKIKEILEKSKIEMKNEEGKQKVYLNGEDVTKEIRSPEVSGFVSQVSSLKIVRFKLVDLQRKLAEGKDVVMEGRDIGTYVFPNADVKIYLDATAEERAKRRLLQNQEKGISQTYEEVLANIKMRDENDKKKEMGALKVAEGATVIDSTNLTIPEVEERVLDLIKKARKEENNSKAKPKVKEKTKEKEKLWKNSLGQRIQRSIITGILKALYIIIYRTKAKRQDNVPKEGPFILCGNHVSFIKVPVMYLFAPRRVHFLAKSELFQNPILNWLGYVFEAIPVKRGKRDVDSMKKCLRTLKEGEPLGIFPEGTRNGLQKKVKVKNGAAYLAIKAGVPIVPVGIHVTPRPFPKIIVNFGKPLSYENEKADLPEKELLEKATKDVMDNIIKLTNEAV